MKSTFVLFVLAAFVAAVTHGVKIDNMEIEQILGDEKIFQQYFDCVMEKGTCTPGGKTLKDGIADQVKDGCASCPPERKERASKIVKFMVAKKGPQFAEFEKKYDPKQMLRKTYAS